MTVSVNGIISAFSAGNTLLFNRSSNAYSKASNCCLSSTNIFNLIDNFFISFISDLFVAGVGHCLNYGGITPMDASRREMQFIGQIYRVTGGRRGCRRRDRRRRRWPTNTGRRQHRRGVGSHRRTDRTRARRGSDCLTGGEAGNR